MHQLSWPGQGTALLLMLTSLASWSFTPSTQPSPNTTVPGNLLLALSVEFPTGLQVSYSDAFSVLRHHEGYFDRRKCYAYSTSEEFFSPTSALSASGTCSASEWSGNFLNWLTMTNLDQFRSVLTGGTRDNFSSMNARHPGDTVDRTVLIRSFSDRVDYNPEKAISATDPVPSTLRGSTSRRARSGGYGSKLIVSSDTTFPAVGTIKAATTLKAQKASCAEFSSQLGADDLCFNLRVEVCKEVSNPTFVGREANCNPRYSHPVTGALLAKPEGLVQEYAHALRFGAVGYLNQDTQSRNGGVLRSAMKSVGSVRATASGLAANPNLEWDENTGVVLPNPDPDDARASGVEKSGLLNYLNQFGYTSAYKSFDPVSELYYAALRYLRGHALPTGYSDALTEALKDGFPVITGAAHQRGGNRDPMISSCQKNFVLGIGDIYTHCDGNLPGSLAGLNGTCGTDTPTDPDNLNVGTLWNRLAAQENSTSWTGGSISGTAYMAGLAHWAHTNDIRNDLSGKQTVATYWVDVLENGNRVGGMPNAGTLKTQFWLTAKYGGFDTSLALGDNPNAKISASSPLPWDVDGNGVPDNWFPGNDPISLRSSLSAAFSKISREAVPDSASSAAVTSSRQTSSSQIIYAGYNPLDWTGTVSACTPTQTAAQCASTPVWEASRWFKTSAPTWVATPLTSETRKIFTSWRGTTFESMPFQWGELNAAQKDLLAATDNLGSARLAYLRGSRSNEGTLFRVRGPQLLGDVVNSGVTYLAGPLPALSGAPIRGHTAYRASTKTRPPVVYVGSNDGMLHAFSGTDGKELFAYIPGSVFANLHTLTAPSFRHRYFVDSTPMVGDFEKSDNSWGTMLVGGLGAGGRGYYALDVSNQNAFAGATERDLSTMPMWEFTASEDADLGFTFNEPAIDPTNGIYRQIAKVADATVSGGVWRVLVGNGYGSTAGKAVLFMLNANTGQASNKLVADLGPSNGLSSPTPVDTDRDGLVDTVYAGDAAGNLHKFQFAVQAGEELKLAKVGQTGAAWRYIGKVFSSGEPITTAPSVAPACDGGGWNVTFGSGKLNEDVDYLDTSERGFYAVVDKGLSSALTVSTDQLADIPYTASTPAVGTAGRTWSAPDLTGKLGWKMRFTGGERVLTNPTLPPDTGAVLFGTTKPTGENCTPGNAGYLMAVNLCSGKIGSLTVSGVLTGGLAINSTGVLKVSNTYVNKNTKPTVVCNKDDCKGAALTLGTSVAPRGRYSWREILTK
jgi:type IV pilus assembly protein PilY1